MVTESTSPRAAIRTASRYSSCGSRPATSSTGAWTTLHMCSPHTPSRSSPAFRRRRSRRCCGAFRWWTSRSGRWCSLSSRPSVAGSSLPGPEQASEQHKLSHVIGVVIGEDERFAQHGLSSAVRDLREQIDLRVAYQSLHLSEVALHLGGALVPGCLVGRRVAYGPVARRPVGGDVFRALRELDDIPLRDPDVLEDAPRGERLARRLGAPLLGRPIGDRVLEGDVGVTLTE